ncbi:hypothetical protein [Prescottella agglutinans]|uniref:Uncharacterized protein n=1 Tax=Prescottella agglutinans TaxID=1644129 RepID=A0ABT6MI92_9NOCA|nr:hypothetical protein [Prescottella agglutinans]MDH6284056.1 hypothetical protein [Prescottella agglutinans]
MHSSTSPGSPFERRLDPLLVHACGLKHRTVGAHTVVTSSATTDLDGDVEIDSDYPELEER